MIDTGWRTTIRHDARGRPYLVCTHPIMVGDAVAYRIGHPDHGAPLEGQALAWCQSGECGWLMQDYVAACVELGLPARYSGSISLYQAAHDPQPPTRARRVSEIDWEVVNAQPAR